VKAGNILIQKLVTGVIDIWEINSINIGGEGEIGLIKMSCLSKKNTIDNTPEKIAVPSNMVDAMIKEGILIHKK